MTFDFSYEKWEGIVEKGNYNEEPRDSLDFLADPFLFTECSVSPNLHITIREKN